MVEKVNTCLFEIVYTQKDQWYMSDNEWQQVTTSGTSDKEWQRITTNDNER